MEDPGNWGDEGLKRMFKQVYDSLSPGGVFIVEPQPWKSYRQAFRKQKMPDETRDHFRAITLKPQLYAEHLRAEIGFTTVETLRSGDNPFAGHAARVTRLNSTLLQKAPLSSPTSDRINQPPSPRV